jgi:hypothetical protein
MRHYAKFPKKSRTPKGPAHRLQKQLSRLLFAAEHFLQKIRGARGGIASDFFLFLTHDEENSVRGFFGYVLIGVEGDAF